MKNVKESKGFTLIELVVVIVILGILAAIAMPKFMDLKSDARLATLQGLEGAIESANSMARSKALVQGVSFTAIWNADCAINNCVEINGTNYYLKFGYIDRSVLGSLLQSMSDEQTKTANNKKISTPRQEKVCSSISDECEYDWCDCKLDPADISNGNLVGQIQLFVPRGSKMSEAVKQDKCYLLYQNATKADDTPVITIESSGC